ncbi:MAG: archaeal proteasome endopeptidase complex subunit alpha [Pyrodictiaceae archaeon]
MSFPAPPAMMGYDRTTAMFSPDGRLFQVEYAMEAAKRGWTMVGIRVSAGVVIVAEKRRTSPLIDLDHLEKVYMVDDHIGAGFVGFGSDGRILIDYARLLAVQYKFTYGEPIPVEYLTKNICDLMQLYTQHGGVRPFGVTLLIGGVDDTGPKLYVAEPSGQYISFKAHGLGQGGGNAIDVLSKEYREDMDLEEAILLGIKAVASAMEGKPTPDTLEIGVVDTKTRKFKKLSKEDTGKFLEKMV